MSAQSPLHRDSIQVHVPFSMVKEHMGLLRSHKINPEILINGETLDTATMDDAREILSLFDYDPLFTVHGPFMDLNPGAVDSKVRAVTLQRYLDAIELATVFGPRCMVLHPGYEKWKYDLDWKLWLKSSLPMWREVIQKARSAGIKIAVENIFEDDPANLIALMEELGAEDFGICFDTGHFNLFSSVPLKDWIRPLKHNILELHLHDNTGGEDAHLPPSEGSFDFDTLFTELKGVDFVPTIEAHNPEHVMLALKRVRAFLNRYA